MSIITVQLRHLLGSLPGFMAYKHFEELLGKHQCYSTSCQRMSCCVSFTGLEDILMPKGAPVAYASELLTMTQQNYAQIEKKKC